VKNKFFSLIHGDDILIAPETKIVPAKEFTELLDARGVLDKVKQDALQYKQEIAEECEKMKEKGRQEGYEAGFLEWAKHIELFKAEIASVRGEYTKQLASIALKATQKIVGKAFEMSDDIIYRIVENALKPVLQHKRITIYVNKKDLFALEKNREKLKNAFEQIDFLSIRERDDVDPGGCVIETEGGIINARLENQWNVLEKAFQKLTENISKEGNLKINEVAPEGNKG